MRRAWAVARVVVCALVAACKTGSIVCCALEDGTIGRADDASCADAGGVSTDVELCEAIGDPDLQLPIEDTTDDPPVATCEAYCAEAAEVCAGDTTCVASCDGAPEPVTTAAVTCAADAQTCPEVGPCWDLLGL